MEHFVYSNRISYPQKRKQNLSFTEKEMESFINGKNNKQIIHCNEKIKLRNI